MGKTLTHAESRRLYSWWWDGHTSIKNSKWLQDNIKDMDIKVKAMIKLLEEDADSFARKAEMYYKKRPELLKLVEELYRAYRAIAERYDHATGALRQAHRTMAEVFPNQIPFALLDESPRGSPATEAAPHTPEISPRIHSTFKENDPVMSKKGLKQLNENVWSDEWRVRKGFKFQDDEENSSDYKALQEEISQLSNGNQNLKRQVDTSEAELQSLKEIISRLNSDKEAAALQHQISLERISTMETEICHSKEELEKLNLLLEEEHQGFMQAETARLSLEELHSRSKEQENFLAQEVRDGAEKLRDIEQRRVILEEELLRIKEEICGFKISSTKREDELRLLTEEKNALQQEVTSKSARADQSEAEVRRLEELISQLNSEKEAAALQHQISLERISTLETEISHFKEELEKLKSLLELEHQGFMQAETARLFLEELHSQSQEQERLLALEIQAGAEKLKDIEQRRVLLEEELQRTKEEINVFKVSSTKQEDELRLLTEEKRALQQELSCLIEDRNTLEQINQRLSEQLEEINLNAESLQALVKELQSQNVELHEICNKHESEKVTHFENNVVLENSLSDANVEIETLREKIKGLEQSCELLCGEVALHLSEKAALVSQVQVISQNLENISQRSVFLEKSLSDASVELESSSGKLRASEEFCQSLSAQNSSLLSENSTLASQVEGTIQILEELEARFVELEDKHLNLERERDFTLNQVMELEDTLKQEKEEYETLILSIMLSSNSQISTLEHQISLMEEEGQLLQEEFEEQEVKFMDAEIEILILQRSLCDINEKNSILSSDSCKLVEANSELKKEILVQEKNLTVSEERNEKLCERIQLMQDENQKHLLEKLVVITILEQFGLDMMDLEMDKMALARESQIKDEELLVLQSKELELLEMNEHLGQDLQALRKERDIIEEENYIIVEEALFLENLYLIYKNASAERVFQLESASDDLACIHGVTNELNEENGLLTEKLGAYEVENVCLKETVLDLYKNLTTTRNICEKMNLDIESGKIHLAQKEIELLSSQDKITELCRALNGFQMDIEGAMVVREELDKKVIILSDDNARRESEISCLRQANELLNLEHERSRKEVEDLRSREEQLTFELKKEVNEVECCEVEIETLLKDIQIATLNEALFEEKVFELLITCERLEIMVREELANKVFSLSENAQNESEILRLHQANEMLNWEINRLHEEVEDLRSREEGLTFELQKEVNELEYCEFEMATLIEDIQFATVNELLFEEKVFELLITCERLEISAMVQREKLYEEISIRNGNVVELNEKLGTMEGENRGLKGELNSYLLIVADLWDDISSLEEEILSLAELYTSNYQKKKGNELVSLHHSDSTQEEGEYDSATVPAGILQLQNLHVKVRALKKVVIDTGSLLKQETFESSAPEIVEVSRAEGDSGNGIDAGTSHVQMMKDIQLDLVLSSSPHMMDDAGSSDQALDSWETIEAESSNIEYHTIEEGQEGKRRYPSHELAIEREPSIDKLELPKKLTESHQEWDRMIVKRLSSDAQRLAVLETSVQDLKKSMEASDMSSCPTSFEFDRIKAQLKEAEESVSQMIDVNSKLTKKARDFSAASMDLDQEQDEVQSKNRRQISELARKGLDRIGRLELELQKIQYLFLKLDEEHESKRAGAGGRRRVLLKDYLYGRMDSRRRKRGPCGCIRPKTRDD